MLNIKHKQKIQLTVEQSRFVECLIIDNNSVITNIIRKTLGNTYLYLLEDTISELYLLICEKINIVEKHTNPKAWLYVSAKTTALSMIQRNKKDLQNDNIEEQEIVQNDTIFEDAVYNIWLDNRIPEKLIEELAPRERQVYDGIYLKKKKPKDLAKDLEISINTVRNIHKKLRDKLTKKINDNNF